MSDFYPIQIDYGTGKIAIIVPDSGTSVMELEPLLKGLERMEFEIQRPLSLLHKSFKSWISSTWPNVIINDVKGTITGIDSKGMRQFRFDSYPKEHALLAIWDSAGNTLFNAKVKTIADITKIFELTESI